MERVASLILNLRNGTEDESATNVEHRGAHGDVGQKLWFSKISLKLYQGSQFLPKLAEIWTRDSLCDA